MLEFKILEELKPNTELLEIFKNYTYTVKNGKTKYLLHTNLKFIEPTEYIVKCPDCGKILSYTNSFKNSGTPKEKVYYHLTCKNLNCKSKGLHYSSDKIEHKLSRVLNELTRYMYDMNNEIIVSNSTKSKDIKDIEKLLRN